MDTIEELIKDGKDLFQRFSFEGETDWEAESINIPDDVYPEEDDDFDDPDMDDKPVEEIESARATVDLRPTEEMAKNAARALEVRRTKPSSERGMIAVGLARARDISNRTELSSETVKRMVSFFARHEIDKQGSTWDEQGKGWQAWHGWGGDEGYAWAKRKVEELEA